MIFKKYKVYYKGKLSSQVEALNRKEAVKKAKNWFYGKLEKGEVKGKARLVLTVDNPNDEIKFAPNFNTQLSENNFFLKKDADKIIKDSNGILRYPTLEEMKKASTKIGQLSQFTRTKRNREPVVKVSGIPYLYKSYGTYYYMITCQSQKTVGTVWQKGANLNVKSSPRWEGDGRKVFTSESMKKNPACLKKGKLVRKYKPKLLRLKAATPYEAVCEILDKQIYKLDKSRRAKKKIETLRDIKTKLDLEEVLTFFPSLSKMKTLPLLKNGIKIINNKIMYSKQWVRRNIKNKEEIFSTIRNLIK
tara:strand:+ start:84 stop:995 length:912 start_codon:yes stop_codon:yes gene_type:complete